MSENQMNKERFRFCIVGTGSIAGLQIKAIREMDNAEVVGLCSSSEERAGAAEEKYGIKAYYDMEEMLDQEKPDAVILSTASGDHLNPCLLAAERGIHVLSEKPLEVTVERAEKMIDACRKHQVNLGCIFQSRFNPEFQKLKKAVDDGKLGDLLLGNAYIKWYRPSEYYSSSPWRGTLDGDGGAALINQGIHTIDLLQYVMGPVKSVYGHVQTRVHDIEGEDVGTAMIRFENGSQGVIEGGTALYPGYPERLEIFGSRGSIVMEGGHIIEWNLMEEEKTEQSSGFSPGSGASDPLAIDFSLHQNQIRDFVESVREGKDPAVTGEEGLKALALIRAIYESSEKGEKIALGRKL